MTRRRAEPVVLLGVLSSGVLSFGGAGCARPVATVGPTEAEPRLEVCVEEARTAEERRRGLIGLDLDDDEGLLLVFPVEGEVCIVNTGVGFAIDAVFADAMGVVVAIEHEIPADDPSARCHLRTLEVLEVRAGTARGVIPGDLLVLQ